MIQAFCRLFRIGQLREVEVIKLVIDKAIDAKMLSIQYNKSTEIEGTMGEQKLDLNKSLMERIFGHHVEGDILEGFTILESFESDDSSDDDDMDDYYEEPAAEPNEVQIIAEN